jgi:hypothetical protein
MPPSMRYSTSSRDGAKYSPVVAVEAHRPRPGGLAELEELGDGHAASEDGHVEQRDRVDHAVRQLLSASAVGEQKILLVPNSVPATG